MLFSQSCGGAPALYGKKPRPVVTDSSTTIAPSGIVAPSAWPRPSSVNLPVGRSGRLGWATPAGFSFNAPSSAASASSEASGSPSTGQSVVISQSVRRQHAGLAGIGEEGERRLGAAQHHLLGALELRLGVLDHEVQAQHRHAAGAALDARRAAGALHLAAGLGGDLAGKLEAARAQARGRR